MKIGVILPSFADSVDDALVAAKECEAVGIHGLFAYDHLWPLGQPGRAAISPYPLLAMVAARTTHVRLGTLVARVGLVSDEVLVAELLTLDVLSGGRIIAGIGTGDHKSEAENRAYGIEFAPTEARRAAVVEVATALVAKGVEVWIGGGSRETNALAGSTGAVLNLWGVSPETVASYAAFGAVSWAGALPRAGGASFLAALESAGASWAVLSWTGALAEMIGAVTSAGIGLDAAN